VSSKERDIERMHANHKSALNTFRQKEQQLIYQELIKFREIDKEEIHRLDRPLGVSDTKQKESLHELADEKTELDAKRLQIDSIHADHLLEVKSQYEQELAQLSLHFDTELIELKARYETRMRKIEEDDEVRRRVDIHEMTERKNSHINELVFDHKTAFTKLKSYYENVDMKDKKTILTLQDDVKDAKMALDEAKRLLTSLRDEHTRLVGTYYDHLLLSITSYYYYDHSMYMVWHCIYI